MGRGDGSLTNVCCCFFLVGCTSLLKKCQMQAVLAMEDRISDFYCLQCCQRNGTDGVARGLLLGQRRGGPSTGYGEGRSQRSESFQRILAASVCSHRALKVFSRSYREHETSKLNFGHGRLLDANLSTTYSRNRGSAKGRMECVHLLVRAGARRDITDFRQKRVRSIVEN